MKKIKIAMVAANLEMNGISAVIMNYCRNINAENFEITLFVGEEVNSNYKNELELKRIKVIELPSRKKSKIAYYKSLSKLMKKEYFDIFHVHGNSSIMAIDLLIAWRKKIRVRIAHSHNSKCSNLRVHKLLSPIFNKLYTNAFACSEKAGDWIFKNNNFEIINNGIDINKYLFNQDTRNEVREKLGIKDDEFVIGHIGRINYQKNQDFLLEIFEAYCEKNEKSKLLSVGVGPLYDDFKLKVENSRFKDKIILYGESTEPEKFYMAMDVFVFPSRYEGLPVTLVEAQVSGLPCVISNKITDEVILTELIQKESIDTSEENWVNRINNIFCCSNDRKNIRDIDTKFNKFDIKNNVKELEEYYKNYLKGV